MDFIFQFLMYLGRWQLSTPILWLAMKRFKNLPEWQRVILANLIGGCIFYFVDRYLIFGK
jgi:hypothetical protein